ncbi:MAG: PglZ domain-containing protein, partial [Schleiferiaceae bacterium]|nr:PglZ domain-containing protein [Schleiferiaceae bacterium]
MEKIKILWVDDEIDLLKPHVMFLENKGYQVATINNGDDALDMLDENNYDIIFLDENMPGLSGIETLKRIKAKKNTPVVMITKSEEEYIMEDAIGSQIADYLIKPVNPNQILLSLKKNLDHKRLISEKTTSNYQQAFRQIGMDLSQVNTLEAWEDMYKRLIYWELELEKLQDEGMHEILAMQKQEANNLFADFIEDNYQDWLTGKEEAPVMSHTVFKKLLFPKLQKDRPVFLIVIDNLRYDQWKVIQPSVEEYFKPTEEALFYSILPTATQFARNAMFAGLMPSEIKRRFPNKWVEDTDEEGKNLYEEDFFADQLKRLGMGDMKMSYTKVTNFTNAKKMLENFNNMMQNDINAIVYNFVDALSHAKTEVEMIRELANNDKAYRSLTLSWFKNSPLFELIRMLASKKVQLIITTDHGTIHVKEPSKLVGERNISTNLRYKAGKNMSYSKKEVFEIADPEDVFLPKGHISAAYVFARSNYFFAYPNNYNYYVKYYRDTYQHGGVSLEEV